MVSKLNLAEIMGIIFHRDGKFFNLMVYITALQDMLHTSIMLKN
jgi:hypothetical protein